MSPNPQYRTGRNAEYYVASKLRKLGASLVFRSAGSHGFFDLIAIFPKKRQIWLIQVKTSKHGVSIKRVQKNYVPIWDFAGTYKVKAGFFYKDITGWKHTFKRA